MASTSKSPSFPMRMATSALLAVGGQHHGQAKLPRWRVSLDSSLHHRANRREILWPAAPHVRGHERQVYDSPRISRRVDALDQKSKRLDLLYPPAVALSHWQLRQAH